MLVVFNGIVSFHVKYLINFSTKHHIVSLSFFYSIICLNLTVDLIYFFGNKFLE